VLNSTVRIDAHLGKAGVKVRDMPRRLFYFDITTRESSEYRDVSSLTGSQILLEQFKMEGKCPNGSFVADSYSKRDMSLIWERMLD
jgi:hypothetical protein